MRGVGVRLRGMGVDCMVGVRLLGVGADVSLVSMDCVWLVRIAWGGCGLRGWCGLRVVGVRLRGILCGIQTSCMGSPFPIVLAKWSLVFFFLDHA